MSSFCTAKATHIFFSKKFWHICVSLDLNFNESLTNDIVSFEQLGPDIFHISAQNIDCGYSLEPPRRGGSRDVAYRHVFVMLRCMIAIMIHDFGIF